MSSLDIPFACHVCCANNFEKFSGECIGIDRDDVLLIVIPDELSRPRTKTSIELMETI